MNPDSQGELKLPRDYPDGISLFYLPLPTPYDAKICQEMSKTIGCTRLPCNGFEPAAMSSPNQNDFRVSSFVKGARPGVSL